jgi:hypothetical protein
LKAGSSGSGASFASSGCSFGSARIVEAQRVTRVEDEIEMIVSEAGRVRGQDAQAARHPEV